METPPTTYGPEAPVPADRYASPDQHAAPTGSYAPVDPRGAPTAEYPALTAALGAAGESCRACGSALAPDQRYCLHCGARRGDPRLAFSELRQSPAVPPSTASGQSPTRSANLALITGVGCLLLALGIGVLIGRSGRDTRQVASAGPPQVISVGGGATGPQGPAINDDWPGGTDGYAVQLQALPTASTQPAQVNAAKTDATSKGATGVGALKSDNYPSLSPGNYIVYSGVYSKKPDADKALAKLKAKFPAASVVRVSPSSAAAGGGGGAANQASAPSGQSQAHPPAAVQSLQSASGKNYVQQSKKLPKQVATGGAPPPIDRSKPAGGGTPSQTIGP